MLLKSTALLGTPFAGKKMVTVGPTVAGRWRFELTVVPSELLAPVITSVRVVRASFWCSEGVTEVSCMLQHRAVGHSRNERHATFPIASQWSIDMILKQFLAYILILYIHIFIDQLLVVYSEFSLFAACCSSRTTFDFNVFRGSETSNDPDIRSAPRRQSHLFGRPAERRRDKYPACQILWLTFLLGTHLAALSTGGRRETGGSQTE